MIKAIASDIDGTLFFPDLENNYKPGDLRAIKHFQQGHNLFGVCTGRPMGHFEQIRALKLDFYIVSTGAVILDKNFNVIEEHLLERRLAKAIHDEFITKAKVVIQTNSLEHFYISQCESLDNTVFKSFDEITDDKFYGVSLIFASEVEALKENEYLKIKYPELEGFVNKNSIDLVRQGCSKGKGIQRIKELMKIDQISGIGDSYNDLSLINQADIGFTFNDSPEALKQEADYLVDSIEEAIMYLCGND